MSCSALALNCLWHRNCPSLCCCEPSFAQQRCCQQGLLASTCSVQRAVGRNWEHSSHARASDSQFQRKGFKQMNPLDQLLQSVGRCDTSHKKRCESEITSAPELMAS